MRRHPSCSSGVFHAPTSGADGVACSVAASVCYSVLTTDVHHLLFENCVLGGEPQVREFRVSASSPRAPGHMWLADNQRVRSQSEVLGGSANWPLCVANARQQI